MQYILDMREQNCIDQTIYINRKRYENIMPLIHDEWS